MEHSFASADDLVSDAAKQHMRRDPEFPRYNEHYAHTIAQPTCESNLGQVLHDDSPKSMASWQVDKRSMKRKQEWLAVRRERHSEACRAKGRLTLGEKMRIIYLGTEAPGAERKTQVQPGESRP